MYSDQQTGVTEAKPVVKIQSASSSPGISIAPRSVVQVPIPDDGSTDSGAVAATVSMMPTDEEVNEGEDEESGHFRGARCHNRTRTCGCIASD